MFERYTENARRVIFFSRYEASSYGSPYIESEHLLLGLLRENRHIVELLPAGSAEGIRKQIDSRTLKGPGVSTSVDLPLSNECRRTLIYAGEEADHLNHKHIGSEHLLLGLLREDKCFAAEMLRERGLDLGRLREKFAGPAVIATAVTRSPRKSSYVVVHGVYRDIEQVHERVAAIRKSKWHWRKSDYKPRDILVQRKTGEMSFDMSLATSENFELLKQGWKKDLCLICDWELFASENDAEHGTGYSNGRDWVCAECYEKFLQGPDYFETTQSDIT